MNVLRRGTVWMLVLLVGSLTAAAVVVAQGGAPSGNGLALGLEEFVPTGELSGPVDIAHAGDERLFVVERGGTIRIVRPNGSVDADPFLDITSKVRSGGERGLLGLVFHPQYAENGYFYVNYTAQPDGDTHISRFSVSADPDVADEDSEQIVLSLTQPYPNHNAGDLLFGPKDGYLYIPLGDGGGGNDPENRAQNMGLLLGKLLRIDVDGEANVAADCGAPGNYTIPADNPFVGQEGVCDEIWASGLRNPWRASFDHQSGDLFMGDVGQFDWEEIDWQPGSSAGGEDYGWSCYEGTHLNVNTNMPSCEDASAYVMPIFEIGHDDPDNATAVTGGFVYRGARYPQMIGRYFLTDLSAPYIWDLQKVGDAWQASRHDNMQSLLGGVVTFGEDVEGELYLAKINDGTIYHLVEDTLMSELDRDVWMPVVVR